MKKIILTMIMLCLLFAGCSGTQTLDDEHIVIFNGAEENDGIEFDDEALNQTLVDWALGTDYGIEAIEFQSEKNNVLIEISDDNYAKFEHYDFDDIVDSIVDILSFYDLSGGYTLTYSNGDATEICVDEDSDSNIAVDNEIDDEETEEAVQSQNTPSVSIEGETVNLIFIHHSVGENWLNAGLNQMLNENNIHVADTYYGWREMGDRTDTADWPDWFNDDIMPTVYSELGNMTGYNSIESANGENTIIMFKSCYPNSEVGNSIDDEKQIYLSLLDYFSKHPDKMFVLITPPPMQRISHPDKTRELCSWLVADDGWRRDYGQNNLFVFDFYNVLTAEDNHHMMLNDKETHIINDKSNTLYYDSWGDDHPSDEGSLKAAQEFVPLLMQWYEMFTE